MSTSDYDVVILGGAFSGATTGILLKRQHPDLRILIVEKSTRFDRKVGESTSEVAGCFLTRILGLEAHLSREQITKHGLRMWFNHEDNQCPSRCSEIGPYYQVRLPTYQLDRCRLDAHLLKIATELGCELWRPASVRELTLDGVDNNRLLIKRDGIEHEIHAKWVVDATGKAAHVARRLGHLQKLESHKTSAIWARFKNVSDLDNPDLKERFPDFADAVRCPRSQATNHLMGHGWWSWIIPLQNGEVSAGLTYDSELFTPPGGNTQTERLHKHLLSHPIGREMFAQAVPVEKDTRSYSGLAYYSTKPADEGWICVGDAAGFIDPLYSQGLDYCAHSVSFAAKIIAKSHRGQCVRDDVVDYSEQFVTSYLRWYHALYQGKYRYLGDAELMNAAFWLDIGTYFIGPVRLVHDDPVNEFPRFPYYGTPGKIFANFMRFYNQRLGNIGARRYAAGKYGQSNLDKRYLIHEGFAPCKKAAFKVIIKGIFKWLRIEAGALFLPRLPRQAPTPSRKAAGQELTTDH